MSKLPDEIYIVDGLRGWSEDPTPTDVHDPDDVARYVRADKLPWISVEDELPDYEVEVLVGWVGVDWTDVDYLTTDEDINPMWANFSSDCPTHWMPIPKIGGE